MPGFCNYEGLLITMRRQKWFFGEQSEKQVAHLIKKYGGTKVLVHYGGQSAC